METALDEARSISHRCGEPDTLAALGRIIDGLERAVEAEKADANR